MVCERGGIPDVAKLLDFGLVVTAGLQAADAKLTQAGMILGTPAYMSPEHCGGDEHPGPASDAVVMQCLAKRPEDRFASAAELERALVPV